MYIIPPFGKRVDFNDLTDFYVDFSLQSSEGIVALVASTDKPQQFVILGLYENEERAWEVLELMADALHEGKDTFYMPLIDDFQVYSYPDS